MEGGTEVSGTVTLLQLGGYVGLLLWGTHMVSTGIERGFGAELRLWLGRTLSRPGGRARLYAFLAGLAVTAVLQSSTAIGLMATSFSGSRPGYRSVHSCKAKPSLLCGRRRRWITARSVSLNV
jgi:hypothetical protein